MGEMKTGGFEIPEGAAMFATSHCPYCIRAERLLKSKGVRVIKIMVDQYPGQLARMRALSMDRRTVPQIFLAGEWIGGCDDLERMTSAEPERLADLLARVALR